MVNFNVGDLIADADIFGGTGDIALVLETPGYKLKQQRGVHHYTVYYCTGPTAGDIVLESVHAMAHFRVISPRAAPPEQAKRESKIFFPR